MQHIIIQPHELNMLFADTNVSDLSNAANHFLPGLVTVLVPYSATAKTISLVTEICHASHSNIEWLINADDFEHLHLATTLLAKYSNAHLIILRGIANHMDIDSIAEEIQKLSIDPAHAELWIYQTVPLNSNIDNHMEKLQAKARLLQRHTEVWYCGYPLCFVPEEYWDQLLPWAEIRRHCSGFSIKGMYMDLSTEFSTKSNTCADCSFCDVCASSSDLFDEEKYDSKLNCKSIPVYSLFRENDTTIHLNRYKAVNLNRNGMHLCNRLHGEDIFLPLRGVSPYVFLRMLEIGTTSSAIKNFLYTHTGQPELFAKLLQGCVIE